MSRADRDAYRAEMQADRSGWKSSMKADRDAYGAEMRSARSDWISSMKADRDAYRADTRSARSDWNSSMKADRDAYRADTRSARSDTFTSMSTTDTSNSSDTTSVLVFIDLAIRLFLASRELYSSLKELRRTNSVSNMEKLSNNSQFSDELKADWNKLMVYGKAKMNTMCQKSKDVFVRAMAKDQCDCQLKDFYKCVDEEGSNKEKCGLFMEKMFECRKNLKMKKADSQS